MHEMIEIKKLDYKIMRGKIYSSVIYSDRFLSIEPQGDGFEIKWVKSESEITMPLQDEILSDWLESPVAYGAYINNELVGFVEGFLEKWNNRFRITNICVFDKEKRHLGIGQKLYIKSVKMPESLVHE